MAEETVAAFLGSGVGYGCMVKGSPGISMRVISPFAAPSTIQHWWHTLGDVSCQPEVLCVCGSSYSRWDSLSVGQGGFPELGDLHFWSFRRRSQTKVIISVVCDGPILHLRKEYHPSMSLPTRTSRVLHFFCKRKCSVIRFPSCPLLLLLSPSVHTYSQ